MQTACWQLCFPIVLRELGTRHASPPRFDPVESVTPPYRAAPVSSCLYGTTTHRRGAYNWTMRGIRNRVLSVSTLLLLTFAAYAEVPMTKLSITVKTQTG